MKAREIKTRIASVKNIAKITKAMKMVAAARLRRFQEKLMASRPYGEEVRGLMGDLAGGKGPEHPLFRQGPKDGRSLILFFTSDRGLCGSFNSNLFRAVETRIREGNPEKTDVLALGRKGLDFLKHRRGITLSEAPGDLSKPQIGLALNLGAEAMRRFQSGLYKDVILVYTHFKSVSSREIVTEALLPLKSDSENDTERAKPTLLFEPSEKAVLEALVPMAVKSRVWIALLESLSSEMSARMIAMENANKNAKDMIDSLTLQYNRARQAGITKELAEIVGGAEALKS